MRIVICIFACVITCFHALAAAINLKRNQSSINDIWMILGAVLAILGIILCLLGSGIDWLISLVGFSCIVFAAIQNGRKRQSFHLSHHIVRITIFSLLVFGLLFI